MLLDFPELRRGLRGVQRPYLHVIDEITGAIGGEELDPSVEFALSPAQLARQLTVRPLPAAPLGAIVFPQIRLDVSGWGVERLPPPKVSAGIWANLYGEASARHEPTLFEELDGGRCLPSQGDVDALSETTPGYRVILGRDAYAAPDFAERLLEAFLR